MKDSFGVMKTKETFLVVQKSTLANFNEQQSKKGVSSRNNSEMLLFLQMQK
jgi:hypothetical protein